METGTRYGGGRPAASCQSPREARSGSRGAVQGTQAGIICVSASHGGAAKLFAHLLRANVLPSAHQLRGPRRRRDSLVSTRVGSESKLALQIDSVQHLAVCKRGRRRRSRTERREKTGTALSRLVPTSQAWTPGHAASAHQNLSDLLAVAAASARLLQVRDRHAPVHLADTGSRPPSSPSSSQRRDRAQRRRSRVHTQVEKKKSFSVDWICEARSCEMRGAPGRAGCGNAQKAELPPRVPPTTTTATDHLLARVEGPTLFPHHAHVEFCYV